MVFGLGNKIILNAATVKKKVNEFAEKQSL